MGRALRRAALLFLPLAAMAALPQQAPLQPLDLDRGSTGLGLALRRVGTSGRVLCVTAHPDDEPNGVLVRLSRGLGVRTALLTVTRGEGGQNLIGPELAQALGVLRTGELMALHRYDRVEQYFGRAYEFGYSFSVEETFAKWGREETFGDVVRVVRAFRPDVILTLPTAGAGGGQHHQAVGRLALEAFRVAADAARFPEQLREGLRPWQAAKIYAGAVGGEGPSSSGSVVRVPTGVFDPLLGATWQQLGSRARAMHRCQGASQLVAGPGPATAAFTLLDSEPRVAAAEADILAGIDTSLPGLAHLAPAAETLTRALAVQQSKADAARAAFDSLQPERAVAPLAESLLSLRGLRHEMGTLVAEPDPRREILDRLDEEEDDTVAALALAQGLEVQATADAGLVTPGQTFGLSVTLANHGRAPVEVEASSIDLAPGWRAEGRGAPGTGVLASASTRSSAFAITVAEDAGISQPYWTRLADRDRNGLRAPVDGTLPWGLPEVSARLRCRIGGTEVTLREPAAFRYPGPSAGGEKRHIVQVVPVLALRVTPEIVPLAITAWTPRPPIELHVFVRSETADLAGEVRLETPGGWSVRPQSAPLRFAYKGEEATARFLATPPSVVAPGDAELRVVATAGGREYRETIQAIEYPHLERRQLVRPAATRVLCLDLHTARNVRVGYVMGSGDAIAEAIRGLGVEVTPLSADDLAFRDLSRFSTIVTGIRAYETRPDLRAAHGRLMRWVEGGGHLVVQYNRAPFNSLSASFAGEAAEGPSPFAPYPAAVTSERISDETAPIRLLAPGHVLLTAPNRIGPADWVGWVQERGIQLLSARDPRYLDLLASSDPFPENPGEKRGLLVDAPVGAGSWTYVGLVLFRQVPAGVPGGWRLLANLVSRPRPPTGAPVPRLAAPGAMPGRSSSRHR